MQRKIYWLLAAVPVVILFACGPSQPIRENNTGPVATSSVAEPAAVSETQGKPLEDLLLAQGSVASANGSEFNIRLVMTKGDYLMGDQVALGGGGRLRFLSIIMQRAKCNRRYMFGMKRRAYFDCGIEICPTAQG